MLADTAADLVSPGNTGIACEQAGQQAKSDVQRRGGSTAQYSVPVRSRDNLSYQQFVQEFMQPNLPVMIQASPGI